MRIKQNEVYLRACVTSIFGVFHATRGPYLFTTTIIIFCGVQKNISRKNRRSRVSLDEISGILIFHHVPRIFDSARFQWTFPLNRKKTRETAEGLSYRG